MLRSYRIVKERYAADAFSGEGARLSGGRWSSPGVPMIYTAGSIALAALEMLVHLDRAALLSSYVIFACTFDESAVNEIKPLKGDWNALSIRTFTQVIGDEWAARGTSPVLRGPSAVVAEESNYLVNPRHADFGKIDISDPRPFAFDARLTR